VSELDKLISSTKDGSTKGENKEVNINEDLSKEIKNLKKNNYKKKKSESKSKFVIQNVKTGKIVEIEANSPLEAVRLLGWRPRHSKLL
jgi:hypothetical protein